MTIAAKRTPGGKPILVSQSVVMTRPQRWLKELILLLSINLVISCLLFLFNDSDQFLPIFVYANSVGFCSALLAELLIKLAGSRIQVWQAHILTIAPGLVLGLLLAALLGFPEAADHMLSQSSLDWRNWALCLLITLIGASFALSRYQAQVYRTELEQERRRLAEYEQADTLAQLRFLQAQIEPHFLFNTLANVHSLISFNPQQAQNMLTHFNGYLRASLQRTRLPLTTLQQELELVVNLLEIAQIRLGERLHYRLEVDDSLQGWLLPPLLLQPLVENALEHGIEPLMGQGVLLIKAHRQDDLLLLRVEDNGVGLQSTHGAAGVGLQNVRLRLRHLYGEHALLALYANQPSGCIAELRIPFHHTNQLFDSAETAMFCK